MTTKNKEHSLYKTKTYLCVNINLKICKRFMLRNIVKITTETAGSYVAGSSSSVRTYAKYNVTDQKADEDDSKVSHPSVTKTSCESEDCYSRNCDIDTQTSVIMAHRTHNTDNINSDHKVVNLTDDKTPRGEVKTVIHSQGQPVADQDVYDGNRFHDTAFVQKDENTAKLNEASKHIKPTTPTESTNTNTTDES